MSSLMIWLTALWAAGVAARIFLLMRVAVLISFGRAYDMAWAGLGQFLGAEKGVLERAAQEGVTSSKGL